MRFTKLRLLLAAIFTTLMFVGVTTITEADNPVPAQQPETTATAPTPPPPPPCIYSKSAYRWNVRRVFRYSSAGDNYVAFKVRKHYVKRATYLRKCAKTLGVPQDYRYMLKYWHHRKAQWRLYAYIDRITPYGKWAIPWPIVRCESGGSWRAANPSGAIGPYQLLGHGAPWPVRTLHDKIMHHLIALRLWLKSGSAPWSPSGSCSGY